VFTLWRRLTMPFRSRRSYVAYRDYVPHGVELSDAYGNVYRTHAPRWWQLREHVRWWRMKKSARGIITVGGGFAGPPRDVRVIRARSAPITHENGVERRPVQPFHT
jgi:hypothetical protein